MNRNKTRNIALNGIMLAVIIALQAINLPNLLTGIIVNAILVFVYLYVGIKSAIILCLLSPFCGFITGHVPVVMYPVLPMIAIGNSLLIISLNILKNKSIWLKILIPSLIKAFIIGFGGLLLINSFIPNKINDFLKFSVLGIQFFTAIAGIYLGIKLSTNKSINNKFDEKSVFICL